MKRLVSLLLVSMAAILLPIDAPTAGAQAAIEIPPEVAALATDIVNATVISTFDLELDDMVYTVHQLQVDAVLAGSAPDAIYVQIPGGTKSDGTKVWYSNSPAFLIDGAQVQVALQPQTGSPQAAVAAATNSTAPVFAIVGGEAGGTVALHSLESATFAASNDYLLNGFEIPDFPRDFRVNPANSGLSPAATVAAVRRGFDLWENDPASDIDFTYVGTTNAVGGKSDQIATVSWRSPSQMPGLGGSLAITMISFHSQLGYEFDIIMSTGHNWTNGAGGFNDIGTVVGHEAGHGLGLSHTVNPAVPGPGEIMHWQIRTGQSKALGAGDIAGVFELYPAAVTGPVCQGRAVTIDMRNNGGNGIGTAGADVIRGTSGNDVIVGGAGNDVICAGGGNDTVTGGDGDDMILGEGGADTIRGNAGADRIDGGAGNDSLFGGVGDDQMMGRGGNDLIGGFGGNDVITGGPGDDTIFGGFGADQIDGNDGHDTIRGLVGNDVIDGGTGNDTIDGDRGGDTINGGDGHDVIRGGNASDVIFGDEGNDNVSGGRADDQLFGGPGIDVCTGNKQDVTDFAGIGCETQFGLP